MPSSTDATKKGSITVDTSGWPLVRIKFVSEASDETFERYLAEYAAALARGPCAAIFDARATLNSKAMHRRRQAEWLRQHDALIRRNGLGVAFCVTSPFIRGAITAIFWLQPPATPYFVTGSLAEAEAWARERLGAGATPG
jgi:hypothetical protein